MTAYHVLCDGFTNIQLIGRLVISRKVYKHGSGYTMENPSTAKLAVYDVTSDFVFLQLDDVLAKSFPSL